MSANNATIEQRTQELKRTDEEMQNKMINEHFKYSVKQRIKDVVRDFKLFDYTSESNTLNQAMQFDRLSCEYIALCHLFIYLLDNNMDAIGTVFDELQGRKKSNRMHGLDGLRTIVGSVLPERMDSSFLGTCVHKYVIKTLEEIENHPENSIPRLIRRHFFGFLLGVCYQFGIGVSVNVKQAYECYTNVSLTRNFTNDHEYYYFSEDNPCPLSSYTKGTISSDSSNPVYELNYLPAIVLCGLCCEYGIGAPKDREKALKHYVNAGINGGDPQALHLLARCLNGEELSEKYLSSMVQVVRPERRRGYTFLELLEHAVDPNRFLIKQGWPEEFEEPKKEARDFLRINWIDGIEHPAGYPRALRELGIWYLCGINVKADYEKAIHYLVEAEKSHYNWLDCEDHNDGRKQQSPVVKLMASAGRPFVPNGKDFLLSTIHSDWAYSLAIRIISCSQEYDPWHATHCLNLINPRGHNNKLISSLTFYFNQFRPSFSVPSLLELVVNYCGEEETVPKAKANLVSI